MEKELIEYLSVLRDFGRVYREKIINGNPKLKSDLKLSQIKSLYAFRDNDCLSMKELAGDIGVKLPNMTMMVDSLIKEGIAERDRDEGDRRKVIVRLTKKGKRVRSDFLARRHRIAQSLFARLNKEDKNELMSSLGNVCRILEKAFRDVKEA
jgi:DNA-binding MarR family transcriptional regulator